MEHIQFLEQLRDRFEALVQKHVVEQGERLVVFVDDLDRCLPEKAIEVLEAIKLFLDVCGCIFVIAVDQAVVVKGIQVRYRDFAFQGENADKMPISGFDYLEKIIQLPFYLPPVRREDMETFIGREARLSEGCAKVFALGVETNPRKIKRTLNVFWIHKRLAEHREKLREVIKPVRLATVVVNQNSVFVALSFAMSLLNRAANYYTPGK